MTQEKDADAYKGKCTKCGHEWTVPRGEWIRLNRATGKAPHCPKCNCGRNLWKPIKLKKE